MIASELDKLKIGQKILLQYPESWIDNKIYEAELLQVSNEKTAFKIRLESGTEKWMSLDRNLKLVGII